MCACKDPEFCPDVPDEPTVAWREPVIEAEPKSPLHRRTFLKAAALGTAAVGGLKLGSLAGLAHTDSRSPCTAGDIEVIGGQIINEPCECDGGTFPAVAQFQVTNNNNANRLNITLHLGPGGTFGGKDLVLTLNPDGTGGCSIGGLGTSQPMYARLGNVSCDFAGECYPGSVVAFQTANNQGDSENCGVPLTKYPGGQCRRQEICIVGFDADLVCVGSCDVACGGTLSLEASAVGGTQGSNGTYRYIVTAPDGEQFDSGAGQGGSYTFDITNPKTGTYALDAYDSNNCVRTASTGVTVAAIPAPVLAAGAADCTGAATFTVDNCDPTLTYTYESATGAPSPQGGLGVCSATFTFPQDGAEHTCVVTASTGDPTCDQTDSASVTINTPVTVTLGSPDSGCSGDVELTAEASGGSGSGYTFQWSIDGLAQTSVTGDTLFLLPQLDGTCRIVEVTATDGAGCVSDADSVSFSQCVTTTVC